MFYIPFFVLLVVLIAIVMFKAVKIVPESQVYIVEKLGKYYQFLSSGLSFINPFFDRVSRIVSLKEQVVDITGTDFGRAPGAVAHPGRGGASLGRIRSGRAFGSSAGHLGRPTSSTHPLSRAPRSVSTSLNP